MAEFVVLRSTLYAYRKLNGKEDKRCKGIKKCVVQLALMITSIAYSMRRIKVSKGHGCPKQR